MYHKECARDCPYDHTATYLEGKVLKAADGQKETIKLIGNDGLFSCLFMD